MKRKFDWHYLRPALILISISVVTTMLLTYFSYSYRVELQTDYDSEQENFQAIEGKFREANEDKYIIEVYSERFKTLESEGVFVAEQRVDWVDSLQAAIRAMKLSGVKYEVSPQRLYSDNLLQDADSIHIYASPVKVEMNLLHEQDMIALLERLERKVMGRFLIESCEMKRAELKFGYYLDRYNLGVSCQLRWLTLSPADSEAGVDA